MKISELLQTQITQKPTVSKRSVGGEEGFTCLFQKELEQQVEGASDPAKPDAIALPSSFPLLDVAPCSAAAPAAPQNSELRLVGSVIDQLDRAAQLLGKGSGDSKALGDSIAILSSEADKLRQSAGNLPQDHPLRQISDELSVLAHVESIKWKNGHYL